MHSLNISIILIYLKFFFSFTGNSKKHITALKKAVDMNCSGEPSLYNSLNLAMQTLKLVYGWDVICLDFIPFVSYNQCNVGFI